MRHQRYLIPELFEFPRLAEGLGNSDVYKTEKNMAYITCKNLELGYKDQIVASGIDFKVEKGDYLYIIGENGAGKTTLVKTLLRLMRPVSGVITYGDGLKPYEIGYLPQQSLAQKDFPASVWEVVLSGNLSKIGSGMFYGKADKERTGENLKKLGIYDLRKKCYRNLSGGQQQRVLLARALCATDKLLLLDEPVSGLDPKVTAEFYALVAELNKSGVTIIMVSHDIYAVENEAGNVLHIGQKGQLFFGTKKEYLNSEARESLR